MPSYWAGVEVESAVGPGPKPRLQPYDVMEPSAEDLEKIKLLIKERESLPSGSRKRRLAIATKIWWLRHPDYKPNAEHIKAAKRRWLENNKEKRKKVALDWYYRNRPPIKKRVLSNTRLANYVRNRRKSNIQFALAGRIRASINRAFRRKWVKKPAKTEALVGCTIEDLKSHIERQFVNGMSWENRHTWHVDHIIPVIAFDMREPDEVACAFNWKNLRPLLGHDNQIKQSTLPNPLPSWLPAHIAERITLRSTQPKRPQSVPTSASPPHCD